MNDTIKNIPIPDVKIAFFDLDKTIIDGDTDRLWATWRSKKSIKGWLEMLWLAGINRAYQKGRLNIERYLKYHRFRIGSLTDIQFSKLAEKFFHESGRLYLFQEAYDLIQTYLKKGIQVVIITAQNDLIASFYAKAFGIDNLLANRFLFKQNRVTEIVKPYCFQEGKIFWAEFFADKKGLTLNNCAFYSDSIHDAPLLSLVKYPFAVNPDELLIKKALQMSWPIIHFKKRHPVD